MCSCDAGFVLNADNAACDGGCVFVCVLFSGMLMVNLYVVDVDECADDSELNNCDTNATCTNTDGSFECACDDGFTGDGSSCDGKWFI